MLATLWFCLLACLMVVHIPVGHTSQTPEVHTLTQSILHTLDYLAVDYPHTVQDGDVVDAEEYDEQREFVHQLQSLMQRLPKRDRTAFLEQQTEALVAAIEQRLPGEQVRLLCADLASALITTYDVKLAPARGPSLSTGASLFQTHCAVCHGRTGLGDGPAAGTLRPPPNNFHDRERQSQRSLYGLYNTITLGVDGTAMPSFAQLREDERWALAFHVSNFLATAAERERGKQLWQQGHFQELFSSLDQLSQATPATIAAQYGDDGRAVLAYLRAAPDQIAARKPSPLAFSRDKLKDSLEAYRAGEQTRAYELAVAAYLEGFELVEVGLSAVDDPLKRRIETLMMQYRQAIQQRLPADELGLQAIELQRLLEQASQALEATTLSPLMGFTGAMVILLREGLEAILILAAIIAFLSKIQRQDVLRYVHLGWIGALICGFFTWLLTKHLISLSGSSRELTEGLSALLATAMLIYVGFWLHNRAHARRWESFLHSKVRRTLENGATWSLAGVSFVAVYREVLETVLFYETLWMQSAPGGQSAILFGLVSALLLLVVLAWGIFRLSIRLPLRLFFRVNAVLLFSLAIILAGQGVAALQEAGKVPVTPLALPRIAILGIYPTLESIGLQVALVGLMLIWQGYQKRQNKQHTLQSRPSRLTS